MALTRHWSGVVKLAHWGAQSRPPSVTLNQCQWQMIAHWSGNKVDPHGPCTGWPSHGMHFPQRTLPILTFYHTKTPTQCHEGQALTVKGLRPLRRALWAALLMLSWSPSVSHRVHRSCAAVRPTSPVPQPCESRGKTGISVHRLYCRAWVCEEGRKSDIGPWSA